MNSIAEEAAFFAAMDREPGEQAILLIFADWLADRNDPREDGYREMAAKRKRPWYWSGSRQWGWWLNGLPRHHGHDVLPSWLPKKWFHAVDPETDIAIRPDHIFSIPTAGFHRGAARMFDLAARAFAKINTRIAPLTPNLEG